MTSLINATTDRPAIMSCCEHDRIGTHQLAAPESFDVGREVANQGRHDARNDPAWQLQQQTLQPGKAVTLDDDSRKVGRDTGCWLLEHEEESNSRVRRIKDDSHPNFDICDGFDELISLECVILDTGLDTSNPSHGKCTLPRSQPPARSRRVGKEDEDDSAHCDGHEAE